MENPGVSTKKSIDSVYRIEKAIQENRNFSKSEEQLTAEWLQKIKKGKNPEDAISETMQGNKVHKISKEEIKKLFYKLKQRVETQRKNLNQLESILSEEIILRIAKGEYFREILKELQTEIFIKQLNGIYLDILKSEITIEKGIKKFGKDIKPLDFFEYALARGDIIFSPAGDAVLFLGEPGSGKTPLAIRMMQAFRFKFGNSDGIRILSCSERLFAGPSRIPAKIINMKNGETISITDPALRVGEVGTIVMVEQLSDIAEPDVTVRSLTGDQIEHLCPFSGVRDKITAIVGSNKIQCITVLLPQNPTSEIFDKAADKLYKAISKASIGSNSLLPNQDMSTNL
ncbi:MAG: hypothetical protein KJ706_05615 [Candidatus Omnitrophica bacterium]|nr:hypothetical protein [Candidatus Omnitrophota bacterium]